MKAQAEAHVVDRTALQYALAIRVAREPGHGVGYHRRAGYGGGFGYDTGINGYGGGFEAGRSSTDLKPTSWAESD